MIFECKMAFAGEPDMIVLLREAVMQELLSGLLFAMVPNEVKSIDDWKQVRWVSIGIA